MAEGGFPARVAAEGLVYEDSTNSRGAHTGRAGCRRSPGLVARRVVYSSAVSPVAEQTGRLNRLDVWGRKGFHNPRQEFGGGVRFAVSGEW